MHVAVKFCERRIKYLCATRELFLLFTSSGKKPFLEFYKFDNTVFKFNPRQRECHLNHQNLSTDQGIIKLHRFEKRKLTNFVC